MNKKIILMSIMIFCSIFCFKNVFAAGGYDWVVDDSSQPDNDRVRIEEYSDKNALYRRGSGTASNDLVFNNYNDGPLHLENFGTGGCGAIEDRKDVVYTFELIGDNTITIPGDKRSDTGFDLMGLCFEESQKIIFVGDGQLTVKYESPYYDPNGKEYSVVYHGGDVYYEESKHYLADEVAEIGKVSNCVSCVCPRCNSSSISDKENIDDEAEEYEGEVKETLTNDNVAENENERAWTIVAIIMIGSFIISLIFATVVLCLYLKERKKSSISVKNNTNIQKK